MLRITACKHDISGSTPGVCMEKLPIDLSFPAGNPNAAGESIARSKLLEWACRGPSSTIPSTVRGTSHVPVEERKEIRLMKAQSWQRTDGKIYPGQPPDHRSSDKSIGKANRNTRMGNWTGIKGVPTMRRDPTTKGRK